MALTYNLKDNAGGRLVLSGNALKAATSLEAGSIPYTLTATDENGWSKDFLQAFATAAPATADLARLAAAFFRGEEWTTSSKIRWTPKTVVNPLEPGIARDEARPGTGVLALVPLSSTTLNIDYRQDFIIRHGEHTPVGPRTGPLTVQRGRRGRLLGVDLGGVQFAANAQNEELWLEGIRFDGSLTAETDAVAVGGASTGVVTDNPGNAFLVNSHIRGVHGTNLSHDTGATITSITRTSTGADVVLSAAGATVPVAGRTVIVSGVTVASALSEPLSDFNDNWTIDVVTNTTTFSIKNPKGYDRPKPAVGVVGSGGKLYVMGGSSGTGAGQHADGLQVGDLQTLASMNLDRVTIGSAYQGLISGARGCVSRMSRVNFKTQLKGSTGLAFEPQEWNTYLLHVAEGEAFGSPYREFYEVYAETRFGRPLASLGMYPDITSNGVNVTLADGKAAGWFPAVYPQYRGIVINASVPDFCDYDTVGLSTYSSPGYSGHVPGTGTITDLTLTLDNPSVVENIAQGGPIGWVNVTHTTTGEIIDVYVSGGDNAANVAFSGRQLVRGRLGLDFDTDPTLDFTLTATVRGFPAKTFTKSFSIPVTDDMVAPTTVTGSYLGQAVDATNGTTWTFAGFPLGVADDDRDVVVAVDLRSSGTLRTINTVTIAGVTATRMTRQTQGVTGCLDLWKAKVPASAGTSGSIVATASGTSLNCGIAAWRLVGADSGPYDVATSTGGSSSTNPPAISLASPADGYVIAAGTFGVSGGGGYHTGTSGGSPANPSLDIAFAINGNGADWTWEGAVKAEDYDTLVENGAGGPSMLAAVTFKGRG